MGLHNFFFVVEESMACWNCQMAAGGRQWSKRAKERNEKKKERKENKIK